MPDLLTQLSEYSKQLDDETPPLQAFSTPGAKRDHVPEARGPWVILVGAAFAVLALIGVPLLVAAFWLGSSPADEPPATDILSTTVTTAKAVDGIGSGKVFTWGGNDLEDWVTESEITAAISEVSSRYTGTALEDEAVFDSEGSDVTGREAGWRAGGWNVLFHDGGHDGRYDGQPAESDPRLPQGVTYEAEEGFGWGFYILSGSNSDELISIMLRPPGKSYGYPNASELDAYEDMLFAIAAQMLRELGWVD